MNLKARIQQLVCMGYGYNVEKLIIFFFSSNIRYVVSVTRNKNEMKTPFSPHAYKEQDQYHNQDAQRMKSVVLCGANAKICKQTRAHTRSHERNHDPKIAPD